jgi:hypothetical protein
VLGLAGRLDVEVENTLIQVGWLLRDVLEHKDLEKRRGVAMEKYDEALRIAQELHSVVIQP